MAALFCTGCETVRENTGPVPKSSMQRAVVLAPGDILSISFPGAPDLNMTEKIRPDGRINLPQVGEVKAGGKSPEALQSDLSRLFEEKLQNASVVVGLARTGAAVYVSGAVNRPGKVSMERPLTAFEAIMESGGFTPGLANPKKVILVRQTEGRQITQVLDLSPALRNEPTGTFYLKPYDTLIVQEKMF
jgi:polysaccharide export outer membrane protein